MTDTDGTPIAPCAHCGDVWGVDDLTAIDGELLCEVCQTWVEQETEKERDELLRIEADYHAGRG